MGFGNRPGTRGPKLAVVHPQSRTKEKNHEEQAEAKKHEPNAILKQLLSVGDDTDEDNPKKMPEKLESSGSNVRESHGGSKGGTGKGIAGQKGGPSRASRRLSAGSESGSGTRSSSAGKKRRRKSSTVLNEDKQNSFLLKVRFNTRHNLTKS